MARLLYTGVSEQSKAGKHRFEDARALFGAKRWRGAMYLAGYAVECLLKVKLMQRHKCRNLVELEEALRSRGEWPDEGVYTHNLPNYLRLLGALDRLRQDREAWGWFTIANQWMPSWRYNPDQSKPEDAEDYLEAIESTLRWIEANT